MAKKGVASNNVKTTFGAKKSGKLKRKYGPKEERPKRYRGQGR